MRGIRTTVLILILGLMLVACGGGAATTTAAATGATTTAATTASTGGQTVSINEIPQECIDAFVTYMKALEPLVEGLDPANMTLEESDAIALEMGPAQDALDAATTAAGCDDIDVSENDEETFQFIVDLARREAPGTVAYWEWVRDLVASSTNTTAGSGDCETDIAAVQAIVDEGGTMQDLTTAEQQNLFALMSAISTECSIERSAEFFSAEDVSAFIGSG